MNRNDRPIRRVVFEFSKKPESIGVHLLPLRLGENEDQIRVPHYIAYWPYDALWTGRAVMLAVPVRAKVSNLKAFGRLMFTRTRRQHLQLGVQFRSFSVAVNNWEGEDHNFNFTKYDENGNLKQSQDLNQIDTDENNDL